MGALLEDAGGALVGEEADVVGEDVEVGVGGEEVAEVGGVVPDEELVGDLVPALDVALELAVGLGGAVGQRCVEVGLDGAEDDDDVLVRAHVLRGAARPLVRGRGDARAGALGLDVLQYGVGELDDVAGLGAFALGDGGAVVALAVGAVVVLADDDELGVGVVLEAFEDADGHGFEGFGVSEAGLGPGPALAVAQGPHFGLEVEAGLAHELVVGVDEVADEAVASAEAFVGV